MNVLFVCSRNKWRSRTAETIFKNSATHVVKSAGTEPGARIKITAKLVAWADIIFVMENKHRQRIKDRFNQEIRTKQVVVLDIADAYGYMDEELIEIIKTVVSPYLET